MRVIIMGPPGAGKGTQSVRLKDYLRVPHLSTGEMLRDAAAAGTELGRQAASFFEAGKLVPDSVVEGIVAARLAEPDCRNGCLLDGFPRTVGQAQTLDRMLADQGVQIDRVVTLEISQQELLSRLALRGRVDDSEHSIRQRLTEYERLTEPVIEHYGAQNLVRTINGEGTADEVFARIKAAVDR